MNKYCDIYIDVLCKLKLKVIVLIPTLVNGLRKLKCGRILFKELGKFYLKLRCKGYLILDGYSYCKYG